MNKNDNFLFFKVAPYLITSGLVERVNNSSVRWKTMLLTEDGKRFLTQLDMENLTNKRLKPIEGNKVVSNLK